MAPAAGERGRMADDRTARAQSIVENGIYMTLATADASGRPWATPVWYALESLGSLIWISRPDARHSQNLTARPQLGIVIFDSHAPIGTGQGVYLEATIEPVDEYQVEAAMAVFSKRSLAQGGPAFSADDVREPAPHRLYRAGVSRLSRREGSPDSRRLRVIRGKGCGKPRPAALFGAEAEGHGAMLATHTPAAPG